MLRHDLCPSGVREHCNDVWLAVISDGRPDTPTRYENLIGPATYYVQRGQDVYYRANGATSIRQVKGHAAAMNAALAEGFRRGLPTVLLSDRITDLAYAVERADSTASQRRFRRQAATLSYLVEDLLMRSLSNNAMVAGVPPTDSLRTASLSGLGTNLRQYVREDCLLVWPNERRFDEALDILVDYDYTAQVLARYGRVCRREKWLVSTDCLQPLPPLAEFLYLRQKWGSKVFGIRGGSTVRFNWGTKSQPRRIA